MSSISQIVLDEELTFSDMKKRFNNEIEYVDGADCAFGENHVDVIFTDGSNVIYNGETPSKKFNTQNEIVKTTIAGWNLSFYQQQDKTTIIATHNDNSPVSDTYADIGSEDELGYRLTTQAIENDYKQTGDANAERIESTITLGNWKFELVNDEDNHLNIYCVHSTSDSIKNLSVKDGTEHSHHCEIVFTDAAYMH